MLAHDGFLVQPEKVLCSSGTIKKLVGKNRKNNQRNFQAQRRETYCICDMKGRQKIVECSLGRIADNLRAASVFLYRRQKVLMPAVSTTSVTLALINASFSKNAAF
jgi:hypothetical protein